MEGGGANFQFRVTVFPDITAPSVNTSFFFFVTSPRPSQDKKKAAQQEPLDPTAKNQSTSQLDLDDDEIINLPEGLTLKDVALTKAIVDEVGVVNILDSGGKVWVASGAKLRQLVAKKRLRWKMFGDAFSLYLLPSALLIAFGHKMFDRGWANCVQSQTVEYIRQEGSNFTITELEGFARPYCKSLAVRRKELGVGASASKGAVHTNDSRRLTPLLLLTDNATQRNASMQLTRFVSSLLAFTICRATASESSPLSSLCAF